MVQPATSTQSSEARVGNQQLNFVDTSNQPKPIKSIIVPEPKLSEQPALSGVTTELPYRTLVDYRADDDNVPTSTVSQAPVDHVTDHVTDPSRSQGSPTRDAMTASSQHTTAGQLINVTSPSTRDATTRIKIGGHVDGDKHR